MKKTLIKIWLTLLLTSIFSSVAMADDNTGIVPDSINVKDLFTLGEGDEPKEPPKYVDAEDYSPIVTVILDVINTAMFFIGSIAILAIIVGGLIMITSSGNENMLQKGKTIFLYAIIGLVVALSAYIISTFVQSTFF